jgi:outer membrane protein assembly factor BamB
VIRALRDAGRLGGCAAVVACAACGGAQTRLALFSTDWEDDGGASIAHVWQRLGGTKIAASTDVVVGVAGRGDTLIGLPLGGGSRWTFVHPIDVRPVVAGTVVVGSGAGETFALDAGTGRVLWKQATAGYTLLGAGDDGAVTVLTFARGTRGAREARSGSELLAVGHGGNVLREITTNRPLGSPAVLGPIAFVPWAGEYVSAIDFESGDEVARVTVRAETSRAWTTQGVLWFGGVGFIRFDEHIHEASHGKASLASPPLRELPGLPRLMPPGDAPVLAAATAEDKARIYARPADDGGPGVSMEDDRWYATYFRIAMGYDAGDEDVQGGGAGKSSQAGNLAWVHLNDADFVGGGAGAGGIVLCDERGKVTSLDAKTGGVLSEADLGEHVESCVVNVDAQRLVGAGPEAKPLAAQLAEAVLADDPQLVVAQRLLLRELAAQHDQTATRVLVDLASDPRTSPDLLADARTALANRRNGASFMEAALQRHYDFLKDVLRAPPVGPIAQALGAMKDRAAAPLLASHLLDPADTDDDVMRAASALAVIAGPGDTPALREFFGMYRASAANDDIAAAVVSVGQALMVVDDKEGRAKVEAAAADASTVPYARDRLEALVSAAPRRRERRASSTSIEPPPRSREAPLLVRSAPAGAGPCNGREPARPRSRTSPGAG